MSSRDRYGLSRSSARTRDVRHGAAGIGVCPHGPRRQAPYAPRDAMILALDAGEPLGVAFACIARSTDRARLGRC